MSSKLVFLLGAVFCAILQRSHLQVINSQYCPSQYPKPDYQGTSPSGTPILAQCNLGDPLSCRSGFSCKPSPNVPGSYYCCQQDYGCPGVYSSAQIDQGTNYPRSCGVVVGVQSCASGYQCIYSSVAAQRVCCSTLGSGSSGTSGTYCPNGGQVANLGGGPQGCTPGVDSCPSGYSCQSGYCCTVQSQGYCPIGSTPALDGNGLPTACSSPPYANCPAGYACTTDYGGSYCCSLNGGNQPSSSSQYCPAGSQPYLLGNGFGNAVTCSPSSGTTCPSGYTCQIGPTGSYYCCTTQNSGSTQYCPQGSSLQSGYPIQCQPSYSQGCTYGYCPDGTLPLTGTNACTTTVGTYCAPGYTCQQGSYGIACCSSGSSGYPGGAYCPPGSNPLYQPGGYPQSCYSGYNSCGDGYSCQSTGYGGNSYCCSVNGGVYNPQYCPNGCSPYYYPGTNLPLSCTVGTSNCPGASVCQCPNGAGSYGARGYCCGGTG
uniref:Uncharacterized protein n=1 Tax=Plectus sambesii TaxID=2011161 RepID=A0A914X2L5_9BILA